MKLLGVLTLAIAIAAVAAACGGDGEHESIETVRDYLRFPLDGKQYTLMDPTFCEQLDEDAEPSPDELCIYRDRSDFGEVAAYLWIGKPRSDEVWEFTMQRQGFRWAVLETQYRGP